MKILEVRLKNLNSLAGSWRIDFEHPSFAGGVFAITGPTGAGKTTILDAICLALYGRTPRLESVSQTANEIMSRRTAECRAETVFEASGGRFRCSWSQSRARGSADGKLQPPKHEISNAETGEIIASRAREVDKKVSEIAGMDFEQFTRSILLAQGDFDKFLKAGSSERAKILERISGADLYSRISMKVHEIRAERRRKLDELSALLSGVKVMSPDEETEYARKLDEIRETEKTTGREIDEINLALAWLAGVERLKAEIVRAGEKLEALASRMTAFEPERRRLSLASRALEAAAEYARLSELRKEQREDITARDEYAESAPRLANVLDAAARAEASALSALEAAKLERDGAAKAIRDVRALDPRIKEKSSQIESSQRLYDSGEEALASIRGLLEAETSALASLREDMNRLSLKLLETAEDEPLTERASAIAARSESLRELGAKIAEKRGEVSGAAKEAKRRARVAEERKAELQRHRERLKADLGEFGRKELAFTGITGDRTPSEWRRLYSELQERKAVAAAALTESQTLQNRTEAIQSQRLTAAKLDFEIQTLKNSIANAENTILKLEEEENSLRREQNRLAAIKSFDEARGSLRDGEPCPLCGALSHPFVGTQDAPGSEEAEDRLCKTSLELKNAVGVLSDMKAALVGHERDFAQEKEKEGAALREMERAEASLRELRGRLSLPPRQDEPDAYIALNASLDEELRRVSSIADIADETALKIETLRKSVEKSKESLAVAEREAAIAESARTASEELLARIRAEEESLADEISKKLELLIAELSPYDLPGSKNLSAKSPDPLKEIEKIGEFVYELIGRRDARQTVKREMEERVRDARVLEEKVKNREETIGRGEAELLARGELLDSERAERDILAAERATLFGERDPDEEEARFALAVAGAERALDSSQEERRSAAMALEAAANKLRELENRVSSRAADLDRAEESFAARIMALGFEDEEEFTRANLPDEERASLAAKADALDDEMAGLLRVRDDAVKNLGGELEKKISDVDRETLEASLSDCRERERELRLEMGRVGQMLEENGRNKAIQDERLNAVKKQQAECERQDLLHKLIGSADGKKYRDFVQGLTFEIMIDSANAELCRITDRYLLAGRQEGEISELDLKVIDNYQAGEVRSTKNLSGGESFLVSMALALGLSRMAGNRARVDSLFLDEGFGALDEETMETALDTLSTLRQDGKSIGVISHISALTERIAAQIAVVPQSGGRSKIIGPGCGPD